MKIDVDIEASVSRGMAPTTSVRVTMSGDDARTYGVANNPPLPKGHIEAAMNEARKTVVAAIDAHAKAA